VVYRAHIKDDETSVILKVLRAVPAPAPEVARFRREYEFTHSLNLPCVVGCHEIRTGGDRNFMVLEDFGGQSLNRLAVGRIDLSTFLEIAHASSAALATIHERNVVHGNLCPSNIVFNIHTGQLKLIDFGCAVDLWEEYPTGSIPCEGVEMAYASPEQVGFSSETDPYPVIDSRSDLYSLGVTLYHLLTGRLPVAVGKPGENGASPASDTLDGGNDKDAGRKDIYHSRIVRRPRSIVGRTRRPPASSPD